MPGLSDLFKNKLFLEYLSSTGSAIAQGKSSAGAINQVTQQNITSGNYTNLLKKLLAGQSGNSNINPDHINTISKTLAGGGKVSIDNKNFNLTGPTHLLNGGDDTNNNQISQLPDAQTGQVTSPGQVTQPGQLAQPTKNPIESLNASDLAGLIPSMISNALSQTTKINQLTPKYSIPGVDAKLTRSEYIKAVSAQPKKTNDIKNYEYATNQGFKGSFEEFKNAAKTTHMKDYEAAVKSGYKGPFNDWLREMAKAGAINLGEIKNRKSATEDISAHKYFHSPKGLDSDLAKYLKSNEVQNEIFQITDPLERKKKLSALSEKFITDRVIATGGKISNPRLDGTTFVWDVKWADGTTMEIRHAN